MYRPEGTPATPGESTSGTPRHTPTAAPSHSLYSNTEAMPETMLAKATEHINEQVSIAMEYSATPSIRLK